MQIKGVDLGGMVPQSAEVSRTQQSQSQQPHGVRHQFNIQLQQAAEQRRNQVGAMDKTGMDRLDPNNGEKDTQENPEKRKRKTPREGTAHIEDLRGDDWQDPTRGVKLDIKG